jgi:hypothetical protein
MIDIAGDTLELGWGGPAGPYLMMTPPIPVHAGETLFAPVSVAVRSGRLGFGALGADGQWLRTYEFDAAQDARTLEFTAAEDGALTLVLYSAAPEPLSARVTHGVGAAADAAVNTKGVYGAGDIRMEGFRVFDHDGRETLILPVGQPARFEIDYRIVRPGLRERAQVLLAFQRNGVQDVFRVMQKDFLFDYDESQTGTLSVALDPLPIAPGTYSIALLIGAEGYYDRPQPLYFTINPEVYFMQPKAVEIEVVGSHLAYVGTGVIGYGKWCASLSHAVEAAE